MSSRGCARADRLAPALRWLLGTALAAVALAVCADEPLKLRLSTQLASPIPVHEALILEVKVNQRVRGEFALYRDVAGDFYARRSDLPSLGLAALAGADELVSLRSLGAERLHFDEARLSLELELPAERLEKSAYDLSPRRAQRALEPQDAGGFANYRLSLSDESAAASPQVGLASEIALRRGALLLRHESLLLQRRDTTRGLRFSTQIVYDRRAEQHRFIAGDHTATSGELGSTLAVGGASFSKVYTIAPYLIRQPLAGFAGAVTTPSQVEVRMGGVPVFREQVAPGPFELRNLPHFSGARDVEIVVRDALGRERVLSSFPYYFADQALREGLHEYSYSAGALREALGTRSNEYGKGAFTAFHRYGASDRVTLGLRGELASGLVNLGPTLLVRDDRLGALSGGLAASEREGRSGFAAALGHVYQAQRFGLRAGMRRYSDHYAVAQDFVAPLGLRAEYGAGASLTLPGWGGLFLDRTLTRPLPSSGLPDGAATRLSYTYSLGARASLFATTSWYRNATRSRDAFLGLLITLDRVTTMNLSARRERDGTELQGVQLARSVPPGEGLGYRLSHDQRSTLAYAQYNAHAASLVLDAARERAGGMRSERVELAAAGAVTRLGGRWGFTRQIEDSFAAVQLGAPLDGVRVYSNNQEVGRTGSDGRLMVPHVGSFTETQISIDERDVPLDYTFSQVRQLVAPPLRSGVLLRFDVRRLRAVEGTIRGAEHARVTLASGIEFLTGRGGRFYVEDLPPGRYPARLEREQDTCGFVLTVPESAAAIVELPEVTACD